MRRQWRRSACHSKALSVSIPFDWIICGTKSLLGTFLAFSSLLILLSLFAQKQIVIFLARRLNVSIYWKTLDNCNIITTLKRSAERCKVYFWLCPPLSATSPHIHTLEAEVTFSWKLYYLPAKVGHQLFCPSFEKNKINGLSFLSNDKINYYGNYQSPIENRYWRWFICLLRCLKQNRNSHF